MRFPRVLSKSLLVLALGLAVFSFDDALRADGTPQATPFSQDWNNTGLISVDDNWNAVPGVVGFRGDGLTSATGVDPQTVVAEAGPSGPVVDVNANQTSPNTFTTGGVAEFHLADPVVALQGSGTARAPHVVLNLSTLGHFSIRVRYNLRDIDGSTDNAVQPVALQYRIGTVGNFVNVPAAFVPDATTGPSLATLVTAVDAALPSALDNQPEVQLRIITTDAVGSDEWVGIDDINVTSDLPTDPTGVGSATPPNAGVGETSLLRVAVTPGANPASTGLSVRANLSLIGGPDSQPFYDDGTNGDVTAGDNIFSYLATIMSATPGAKALPATITDAEGRSGFPDIPLAIETAIDPLISGSAVPGLAAPGSSVKLLATVIPGAHPASTDLAVTGNLAPIGGSSTQAFFDDGSNGDLTAGDHIYSFQAIVSPATLAGFKTLPLSVSDAEGRAGSGSIGLTVVGALPSAPQPLPFFQDWTNTTLITTNNDWTSVPGIVGYRGDDLTTLTGVDPQTILADGSATPLSVLANQTNPNTNSTGAVAEFHITNPTIALQGSGTADAPHVVARLNTTGLGSIRVSYNLRDIDGSADNAVQPVALQYRAGNSGPFTNVPEAFVPDATMGPSSAVLVTPVSVLLPENAGNQPDLEIRWITANAGGNDEWVGIDDIVVVEDNAPTDPTGIGAADPSTVPQGAATLLTVRTAPGRNPTSTVITASVMLNAGGGWDPLYDDGTNGDVTAGDGTFSFEYAIPASAPTDPATLPVMVNDAQGRSSTTSINFTIAPPPPPPSFTIPQIQGAGSVSPYDGQAISVRGVVTGLKFNGFFIQSEDGTDDGDPNTSEGVFVFTSAAPPPVVKLNRLVDVVGTVHEFVPSADPEQRPLTEITNPAVSLVTTGVALPSPIVLTTADTLANGGLEQLERYEGMRVQVSSLTVTGPTLGSVNEQTATGSSNGVFYGVITGLARPFREPGIEVPDPLPVGAPLTVPRFDGNPERLQVDTNGQLGATGFDVAAGDIVTNIVGPLDYSFRTYLILPDPSTPPAVFHTTVPIAVSPPAPNQFTVGAANLERFFDTTNDPDTDDPVLTPTAFANRLNKASLFVRNILRMPDVLGVEEVENFSTLQTLAAKINADAVANGDPDPQYQAFLEEGNDIGGIDLGALVKTSRISVVDATQEGKDATYIDPNTGNPALLNDRPSLIVRTVVPNGTEGFPITVIVNHLRSLSGVDDPADGNRVRTKRRAQAEFLANLIQSRQTANPDEVIVSVGDYNAFQFNDGFVDSIGTIKGTPAPPDQVTLASPDLVDPDLVDLVETAPPDQRYSFVFDGNAQELDHILVTQNILPRFAGLQYGRSNADFPETARNDPNSPARISDHDPVLAYFTLPPAPTTTGLASSANPSRFGEPVTFTATVSESGHPVPTGTVRFLVDGATMATLAIDANGQTAFTTSSLPAGSRVIAAQFIGTDTSAPSDGTVTQAVFPAISINDVLVYEPNTGTTPATFTLRLSAPSSQTITVDVETANGTAIAGSDFRAGKGTITFAPGVVTKPVSVSVLSDSVVEGPQTFTVVLSAPVNATIADGIGKGVILDKTAPRITSFAPAAGAPGSLVDIIGVNFQNVQAVRFGQVPATTFTVISPTRVRAKVPLGAVDGPITVSTTLGPAISQAPFVVLPLIVGFAPPSGAVGSAVVIAGAGMSSAMSVRFGAVSSPFTLFSISGIDVILTTVPAGAVSGPIRVTTPAGTATSSASFVVVP